MSAVNNLVSVIIPCYNGERYLKLTIDSVLAQTHPQVEIIVVDDGSRDRSHKIVAEYPTVRYIYQQNQGVAAARNRGFQESQGRYVLFLDQDDCLLPDSVATNLKWLEAYPQCGFAAGTCVEIDENGNYSAPLNLNAPEVKPIELQDCYERLLSAREIFCPPSALLFRREVFEAVGGFDGAIAYPDCSDYDLYLRIARHAFPIRHYRPTVEYRSHGDNTSKNTFKMLKGCLHVLDTEAQYFGESQNYKHAYRQGRRYWKNFFADRLPRELYYQLKRKNFKAAKEILLYLVSAHPQIAYRFPALVLQKVIAKVNR